MDIEIYCMNEIDEYYKIKESFKSIKETSESIEDLILDINNGFNSIEDKLEKYNKGGE